MDWLTQHKLPLGQWVNDFIDMLQEHAADLFDSISYGVEDTIAAVAGAIQWLPFWVIIAAFAALAFGLHRSWKLAAFVVVALLMVVNLGYWNEMIETLVLVLAATALSIAIGIPVGILAAHKPWLYTIVRPLLDLMQTIPPFVYLIPTMVLFSLGATPALISTIIFAIAAPIRLTYLGISNVPEELVEAGKAFGASRFRLLFKVELPAAMPNIMAGVTQCIMLSLSMVVIAALVGADGLGKPVVQALGTSNIPKGFEAGLAIVLLAIVLDRICKLPGNFQES